MTPNTITTGLAEDASRRSMKRLVSGHLSVTLYNADCLTLPNLNAKNADGSAWPFPVAVVIYRPRLVMQNGEL